VRRARRPARPPVGLALAGGGPFGAIYEIGALMALEDSLEGIDLNELHCYVGVSAGSFLAAALANGNRVDAIYRMFIEEGQGQGALTPGIFMRPAFREYRRRARILPGLLARSAWRYFTRPFSAGSLEAFAALGRAIPTGIFDNEAIHEYLEEVFTQPGQTNDFRKLRRRLFLVATDLDSGRVVSFGRPGRDDVPISKAVQASSALPGLFPPVEIGGHHFVDGALKKTLHASEALDAGARLVICINPIVPFDARLEASRKGVERSRLVEGGLPVVLSQTFRAVIHSRMAVGMSKYESQYRDADVVLFQPDPDDATIFFTNIFSYATRRQVCEHAYQRTRADLLQRRDELQPILARHGIRMRLERLAQPQRRLEAGARVRTGTGLSVVADNLRETLRELRRAI
jgi:predicted acylesterase/phospholipase RssA